LTADPTRSILSPVNAGKTLMTFTKVSILAGLLLVPGCATLVPVVSSPFHVGESESAVETAPGWFADPVDVTTTESGSLTQYKVTHLSLLGTYTVYVYVEGGKVTAIQDLGIIPDATY
jgi:hypothetical protein